MSQWFHWIFRNSFVILLIIATNICQASWPPTNLIKRTGGIINGLDFDGPIVGPGPFAPFGAGPIGPGAFGSGFPFGPPFGFPSPFLPPPPPGFGPPFAPPYPPPFAPPFAPPFPPPFPSPYPYYPPLPNPYSFIPVTVPAPAPPSPRSSRSESSPSPPAAPAPAPIVVPAKTAAALGIASLLHALIAKKFYPPIIPFPVPNAFPFPVPVKIPVPTPLHNAPIGPNHHQQKSKTRLLPQRPQKPSLPSALPSPFLPTPVPSPHLPLQQQDNNYNNNDFSKESQYLFLENDKNSLIKSDWHQIPKENFNQQRFVEKTYLKPVPYGDDKVPQRRLFEDKINWNERQYNPHIRKKSEGVMVRRTKYFNY